VINGGLSLPPGRITNVAGTCTFVEPAAERGVVELLAVLDAGMPVAACVDEVVLEDVGLVAVAEVEVATVAEPAVADDEWLELPQAPSRTTGSSRSSRARPLTVPA
jgi:hypothetical protein